MSEGYIIGGGSNGLALRVIGSPTQPSNPKEPTIWVQTSTPISGWEISAIAYTPTWQWLAGYVYFFGAVSNFQSTTSTFNVIKKNGVFVQCSTCHQNDGSYDAPQWTRKNAYLYTVDNGWVQISSMFAATINITYPAGSTCTVTDGTTTYTAPDTSGTWTCIVGNTGTWTVTATNGDKSKSQSVSITTDGQTASIELVYQFVIYKDGTESVSLAFQRVGDIGGNTNAGKKSDYVLFDNRASNYSASYDHHTANTIKTTKQVSLTGYSKLCCRYTNNSGFRMRVGIKASSIPEITWTNDGSTYDSATLSTAASGTIELDISNVSGSRYVGVTGAIQNSSGIIEARVYEIWLE